MPLQLINTLTERHRRIRNMIKTSRVYSYILLSTKTHLRTDLFKNLPHLNKCTTLILDLMLLETDDTISMGQIIQFHDYLIEKTGIQLIPYLQIQEEERMDIFGKIFDGIRYMLYYYILLVGYQKTFKEICDIFPHFFQLFYYTFEGELAYVFEKKATQAKSIFFMILTYT